MFKVALAVFKFNQKFILNTKDFSKLVIQLKFTNLDCDTLLEVPSTVHMQSSRAR